MEALRWNHRWHSVQRPCLRNWPPYHRTGRCICCTGLGWRVCTGSSVPRRCVKWSPANGTSSSKCFDVTVIVRGSLGCSGLRNWIWSSSNNIGHKHDDMLVIEIYVNSCFGNPEARWSRHDKVERVPHQLRPPGGVATCWVHRVWLSHWTVEQVTIKI